MKRQTVLIFGHGYATQFIDISNQYTTLFDKEKYQVIVAYLVGKPNEIVHKKHLADQVIFLNNPKKSTRGLKLSAVKHMLRLHRQFNFQIVICHRYKPTYIMCLVNLFHPIPRIFSVMHELKTFSAFSRKLFVKLFGRQNITFAGVSNAVRDDLRQSLWGVPPTRIITLYNMIDVQYTQSKLLSRVDARQQLALDYSLDLKGNPFIFGTLGRLVTNKDHQTLITAFAQVKQTIPHAKLIIMGDGQLEKSLKNQVAELNLTKDIIFTGFVVDGFRFLRAFDIYISSSIQEAFGRVLLETMIAQVPIIATQVNGVPEVIGDAGILIDAKNPQQMSQAMIALFSQQDKRTALSENGLQRATRYFSFTRFNELFWELL